ncbi:MAG: FG-GAP-like repeat-containing protein [Planctomycetaceae bacterium]|nr:FG-GAP-like repeat-containing protein [Planctomycetaceae bacterium]
MKFPQVVSYTDSVINGRTWEARGAGSLLEFSALTTLMQTGTGNKTVRTYSGGKIDLSTLTTVSRVTFSSNDEGSVIDISGLPNPEGIPGITYTETNGGQIIYYTGNRLAFTATMTTIPENAGLQAAQGTVTRNGNTSQPLTVYLTSSNTSALTVPESVTIPAGESSATFWISVYHDDISLLDRRVTVTGTADHYISDSITIIVADVDKGTDVPYTATVSASVAQAPIGTPVVLSGSAIMTGTGLPATYSAVDIHITVRGFVRVVRVTTDNEGNFSTTFTPLPGEGGRYTVFACHPRISSLPAQCTFDLIGMPAENVTSSLKITEGSSQSGSLTLRNPADVPLTGVTAEILHMPDNLHVTFSFGEDFDGTLASLGTLALTFFVEALDASVSSGTFTIRIASEETESFDLSISFQIDAAVPRLQADTSRVEAGMVRGKQSLVSFEVANIGGLAADEIEVMLPRADWLSLASPSPSSPLAPGESMTVTLRLNPSATIDFGAYSGQILLRHEAGHLFVPFTFFAVSEALGNLAITVTDEYTYFTEEAPNLAGARVRITDAITGEVVSNTDGHANGLSAMTVLSEGNVSAPTVFISDENGQVTINNLTEGYYNIQVSAVKHHTYNATVFVAAGQTKHVEAFLQGEFVTYTWTVVPTEIEDVTAIKLVTEYEVNVPAPVVIAEPQTPTGTIDLTDLTEVGQEKTVIVKITNHGWIAAQNLTSHFPTDHPVYVFEPLIDNLGTLAAKTSIYLPVIVRCIASPTGEEEIQPMFAPEGSEAFMAAYAASPLAAAGITLTCPPAWEAYEWECLTNLGNIWRFSGTAPVAIKYPWPCGGSWNPQGGHGGPGGILVGRVATVTEYCVSKPGGPDDPDDPDDPKEKCEGELVSVIVQAITGAVPTTRAPIMFVAILENVDYSKCTIEKVEWKITSDNSLTGQRGVTKTYPSDGLAALLILPVGTHGVNQLECTVTLKNITTRETKKLTPLSGTFELFFQHDATDNKSVQTDSKGNVAPNWYWYWAEDGAVPLLKDKWGEVSYSSRTDAYGFFDPDRDRNPDQVVCLTNLSTTSDKAYRPVLQQKTFPAQKGINLVATTLLHELEHKFNDLAIQPGSESKGEYRLTIGQRVYIAMQYAILKHTPGILYDLGGEDEIRFLNSVVDTATYIPMRPTQKRIQGILTEVYTGFLWIPVQVSAEETRNILIRDAIQWNDGLSDTKEDDLGTSKFLTDTFAVGSVGSGMGSDCFWYGDNEYASRLAELNFKEGIHVNKNNDWSNRGQQTVNKRTQYVPNDSATALESPTIGISAFDQSTTTQVIEPNHAIRVVNHADGDYIETRFVDGPYTESAMNQVNGLYEALQFGADIEVAQTGTYWLIFDLTDSEYNLVACIIEEVTLTAGLNSITVNVPSANIASYGVVGTFTGSFCLCDNEWYPKDVVLDAITTKPYTTDQFAPLVSLGDITATVPDADANGYYDGISLTVPVHFSAAGDYICVASLVDADGNFVVFTDESNTFNAGDTQLEFFFDGKQIFNSGLDGPYSVAIVIVNTTLGHRYSEDNLFTTDAYLHTQFEGAQATFTDVFSDSRVDMNGDATFYVLRVNTGIQVNQAGIYDITAYLQDSDGNFAGYVSLSPYLEQGEQTVALDFNGNYLTRNGAFTISWLQLRDAENGTELVSVSNVYTTQEYDIADFKPREIPQTGGVCAVVKLELSQNVIQTRDAFDATLTLNNGTNVPIEHVGLSIVITDAYGNDATDLFGIYPPTLVNMTAVDGSGTLAGNASGSANWIIVPTTEAANFGVSQYSVGGTLQYRENGVLVTVPLYGVEITVLPQPELYIDYFWQRDVWADDPWTEEIESSIPFELAVMIRNEGQGDARNLKIESAQPQIIENEKGLLIDFQIIGTNIAGQSVRPTLTANFGTLAPGETAIGQWWMVSTLLGQFISYEASYTHINPLGDQRLSLIKDVQIHELIKTVYADREFDDGKPDFLVNGTLDSAAIPDSLYLSDGSVMPVGFATQTSILGQISPSQLSVTLEANMRAEWCYLRLAGTDPGGSGYRLVRVLRDDGSEMHRDNFWQTDRTFVGGGIRPLYENSLHLLDYNETRGTKTYTLIYEKIMNNGPVIVEMDHSYNTTVGLPVDRIDMTFNKGINPATLTRDVLLFTKEGGLNLINDNVTITPLGGNKYRVAGLASLASGDGQYRLFVDLTKIATPAGDYGIGIREAWWTVSSAGPIFMAFVPQFVPGTNRVESLLVQFDRAVIPATFDARSLLLQFGDSFIDARMLRVTPITPEWFEISNIDSLCKADGTYTLTIVNALIADEWGQHPVESGVFSWTVDTQVPDAVFDLSLTADGGNSVTGTTGNDFITNNGSVHLHGQLAQPEPGMTVTILDAVTKQVLAVATIDGNTFSAAVGLPEGSHSLLVRVNRLNGHYTETPITVTVDTTNPRMEFATINFNDVTGIPESATFVFTKNVFWQPESPPILRLVCDDGMSYDIDNSALSFDETMLTLDVDLTSFVSRWKAATYQIVIDCFGLTDIVGNVLLGGSGLIGPGDGFPVFNSLVEIPFVGGDSYSAPTFADLYGEGLLDLLVGEKTADGTGKIRLYLNQGTAEFPVYSEWYYLQNIDGDITVPGTNCQGIIPRLADLTGDGLLDLIVGDGNGNVYVYYNQGTAISPMFGPQERLYYRNPSGNLVAITVGGRASVELADINGNGCLDLLVGDMDGRIHVYLNGTTSGEPEFVYAGVLQCNGSDLVVPSGRASFAFYDLDGDGRRDLVSGDTEGRLWFYKNIGADTEPVFDVAVPIMVSGIPAQFEGQARSRPVVVDYNHNGTPDIVVGVGNGRLYLLQGTHDASASFMVVYNQMRDTFTVEFCLKTMPPVEEASLIVTTDLDVVDATDGQISLREAIAYAGTNDLGTTITFADSMQGRTISLDGWELLIDKNITIDGTGRNITIDANGESRVLSILDSCEVALVGLTITGGHADEGGGIYNEGMLTILDSMIVGNSASLGGGIYNDGLLTIITSIIQFNSASSGGGIFSQEERTLTLANCLLVKNSAELGGGVFNGGVLSVTNSTIAGNTGMFGGGGIYNDVTSTLWANNTIVAQNTLDDIDHVTNGTMFGNNNLIGDGSAFANGVNGNIVGTAASPIDPLFVDAINGDYRLTACSSAIDNGSDDWAEQWTIDLDGNPRFNGTIDIGAYEYQGIPGHDYEWTYTDPTCTEDGYWTYICTRCNDVVYETDPNTAGHDYEWTYTDPTCTDDGFWTLTCVDCGDVVRVDDPDTAGHDYEWTYTDPTCTDDGFWTLTCVDCGDVAYVIDPDTAGCVCAPVNLRMVQRGQTAVSLQWNAVAGAAGYIVERECPFGWIDEFFTDVARFIDTGLEADTAYTYSVRTLTSGFSMPMFVTTLASTETDVPIFLDTYVNEFGQITLTWTDLGEDYTYTIFRQGQMIARDVSGTSFLDTKPPASWGVLEYSIRAFNESTQDSARMVTTIVWNTNIRPVEFTGFEITEEGIQLLWDMAPDTEYQIMRLGATLGRDVTSGWTDNRPMDRNDYVLMALYEEDGRLVRTYSNVFTVQWAMSP